MKFKHVYNESCINTMKEMPENFVNLTLTSPPYDDLRKKSYQGTHETLWKRIIKSLYRVTKEKGTVVWVVNDGRQKDGGLSGTSFKQCLHAMECGFLYREYIVYEKNSCGFPAQVGKNLHSDFREHVFVWSKGAPAKGQHNIIADRRKKYKSRWPDSPRFGVRSNIWRYNTSSGNPTNHPAVFPKRLAEDVIRTFSNQGEIVYDPMVGGGTTIIVAEDLNRQWIASEMNKEFCNKLESILNFKIERR